MNWAQYAVVIGVILVSLLFLWFISKKYIK